MFLASLDAGKKMFFLYFFCVNRWLFWQKNVCPGGGQGRPELTTWNCLQNEPSMFSEKLIACPN